MEIAGKISANKKGYGKYIPQSKSGGSKLGKNKRKFKLSATGNLYEEIAGLNDLDSSIMGNNFEENIAKEPLRLEIMIEKTEKRLQQIKEELKANELFNIKNEKLEKKQELLNEKFKKHRQDYRNLGFEYKVADTISQISRTIKDKAIIIKETTIKLIPSAKEREKVKYAKILNKKLSNEMNRPVNSRYDELEPLLFQAEKLNKIKIS